MTKGELVVLYVPDVRRKQVKAESLDGVKIMRELYTTNFDAKFDDRYWRVGEIHLIENDKLKSRYEEYKKELLQLGRPSDSITETLAFSAETERSCKDICQEGYKVGSKKRSVLGHTGSGVHLVRHYDILTRYLMFQQYTSPAHIVVYKTFLGKTKPIVPRLHKDDSYVPPYVGFDCHVSARHVDKEMPICEALNCSYVYMYEFDQIASNPVKYPRQILPYVIIQLEKKVPCVPENPFLAVGTDETRSTWEVKGETRRGFRFMFTKSGLKGKHKVFSKGFNRANIESNLKGQILEMRTKSAGSAFEGKPPLLQKIDDSSINISEANVGISKPPALQKFTSSSQEPTTKTKQIIFNKEIENLVIPKTIREIRQLSILKPHVKIKRLDAMYLTGVSFKIDDRQENTDSKDKEKANSDTDLVPQTKTDFDSKLLSTKVDSCNNKKRLKNSETEVTVSSCCETRENESTVSCGYTCDAVSKTNNINTASETKEVNLIDNNLRMREHLSGCRNSTERKSTFKHSDKNTNETDFFIPEGNFASGRMTSGKTVENQTGHRKKNKKLETDQKETNKVKDSTELFKTMDRCLDIRLQTNINTESASFCDKLSDKEISCSSNISAKENKMKLCTAVKQRAEDHSLLEDFATCMIKSSPGSKLRDKNVKTNKKKKKIHETSGSQKIKTKYSYSSRNTKLNDHNTDIGEMYISSEKHFLDQGLLKNKRFASLTKRTEKLKSDTKRNTYTIRSDEDETKLTQRKEKKTKSCLKKGKKMKTLTSRCSPSKTKFGKITYKISKKKGKTGKYSKGVNRYRDISKHSGKRENDMQTVCNLYDFHVSNQSVNQEQNSLRSKLVKETRTRPKKSKTVNKVYENASNLKNVNNRSVATGQLLLSDNKKESNDISVTNAASFDGCTSVSVVRPVGKGSMAVPDLTFEKKQSQNQSNHTILEKSKSPVVANAAPDMLNMSPVLVSAQISTCSTTDTNKTIQYKVANANMPLENQQQTNVYQDNRVIDKGNIFFSEMSAFYGKTDKVKSLGLIEHFPEPLTQTHVVNPVLRAALTDESKLQNLDDTNFLQNRKTNYEQSQRKLEITPCVKQTEPFTSALQIETDVAKKLTNFTSVDENSKTNTAFACKPFKTTSKTSARRQNDVHMSHDKSSNVSICDNQVKKQRKTHKKTKISTTGNAKASKGQKSQSKLRPNQRSKGRRSKSPGKNKVESNTINNSCNKIDLFKHQILTGSRKQIVNKKDRKTMTELNGPGKKEDKINKEKVDIRSISCEKENSSFRIITSPIECYTYLNWKNPEEQQQNLEIFESTSQIKVDMVAADRFRSFLNSASTEPMQPRKSNDQNDTEEKLPAIQNPTERIAEINFNLPADQKNATVTENCINSETQDPICKNPNPNHETKTKDCSNDFGVEGNNDKNMSFSDRPTPTSQCRSRLNVSSRTEPVEAILKEPMTEPRVMLNKHNRLRDSVETHDNDSQDTVIGGVMNAPFQQFNSVSSSERNTNPKYFDESSAKEKTLEVQSNDTYCLKEEKTDDGYHDDNILNAQYTHSNSERHPSVSMDPLPNTFNSLNGESHNEKKSSMQMKQEPFEHMSDDTLNSTHNVCIERQSVKTEQCSPSSLFPKTRRELVKGAAMLNAAECRSAIVDTLRELSSVLKYLTDSKTERKKETENVAFVAKKMCNVLSGGSTTEALKKEESLLTVDLENNDNIEYALRIKTEPTDTENSKSMDNLFQSKLKNSNMTPAENLCRSEGEKHYYNSMCQSSDHEFQYDYILNCPENEQESTCESVTEEYPLKGKSNEVSFYKEPEKEYSILFKDNTTQNNSLQNQFLEPFSDKAVFPINQHEADELPRLFDPSEEQDISCLEQFGIPKEFCKKKSVATKHSELNLGERSPEENNTNTVLPVNDLVTEIKTENIKKCEAVNSKLKRFSLKTGVLNKGLKDRKNMFDLKTNGLRRKTVLNEKPTDGKFARISTRPVTEKLSTQKCVHKKTEQNESTKIENQPFHDNQKTNDIMNEVYKTVCEKLSTLKENCTLKNDHEFSLGHSNPVPDSNTETIECDSKKGRKPLVLSKGKKSQTEASNTVKEIEHSRTKNAVPKEEIKTTSSKKHAIIPYHTVIKLKKHQFWKYRRGETNKKFIDYRELFSKMSKRQDKSYEKDSSMPKEFNSFEKLNKNAGTINTNENLCKKLNYFIPNCKTSEINERGTALFEDNKDTDTLEEKTSCKRNVSDIDERKNTKRIKLSSEKYERSDTDSRRSRSRSSHRSSTSQHESTGHTSLRENHTSSCYSRKGVNYSAIPNHMYKKSYHNSRPVFATRTPYYGRGTYKDYSTRLNVSSNNRFGAKSVFNRSGTGYFSWRRKYHPRKKVFDGFIVNEKGIVRSALEYAEWNRFKERETLRDQIESAINEYRRTFEDTPDDIKGDEKVASYLAFLTEKLNTLQSTRNTFNMTETNQEHSSRQRGNTSSENVVPTSLHDSYDNKSHLYEKLEKSHNFYQHETHQHSSVSRLSSSLASDSDIVSYKQRRHASGIEALLKEHITKHYEHLTKQIKQEMEDMKKSSSSGQKNKEISYSTDLRRNRYNLKKKLDSNEYPRHSDERYESDRTRKDADLRPGDEYNKTYYGTRGNPYDRTYTHREIYGEDYYSYDRMGREHRYDNRYSHRDRYEKRKEHFRNQENSDNESRYNKDNYFKSKYRMHFDKNFDNSKRRDRTSIKSNDHIHERSDDYRKTYDYQQNFDKYQENFLQENQHDDHIKSSNVFRYNGQHSRNCQPNHWFREKYKKYYNKDGSGSVDKSEGRNEIDNVEADTESVLDEFDAAQYRQFIPALIGYNKRGRGLFKGVNRFQPSSKQHYQPAKFSRFRNPIMYFSYGDEHTDKDNKNGNKTSTIEKPRKAETSVEITRRESDRDSNQAPASKKADQPKPIPLMCGSRQISKK